MSADNELGFDIDRWGSTVVKESLTAELIAWLNVVSAMALI